MNGVHDMGGMQGFGPIEIDQDYVPFHSEWERRVHGVLCVFAINGYFNFDDSRYAIERMGNAEYLTTPYYEHWLAGLEIVAIEKGVLTADEIETRKKELREKGELLND